jgi:gas vesicle protein
MENHSVPKAAVSGFVTGMVAGGALALLFAPASGRLTRARLNHRLGETFREAAESARELKERMSLRLRDTAGSAHGLKKRLWRRLRPARPDTATAIEPKAP